MGAASAVGVAPGVMECSLLRGGAGLDVSEGDQWQMCVLTPRRPGSVSSYTPCSFSVELKEMKEGLQESSLHWPINSCPDARGHKEINNGPARNWVGSQVLSAKGMVQL